MNPAPEVDLKPFCGNDPLRFYLHRPWSQDEFSYATNGHIIVRVPRRADIAENKDAPNTAKVFANWVDPDRPLPPISIPPEIGEPECRVCDGRGTMHNCPDCGCTCKRCEGRGATSNHSDLSIGFAGECFAAKYIKILMQLPSVTIANPKEKEGPLPFAFDGGIGMLMPIRGRNSEHIQAEGAQ